jgi:hypothetical protein
MELHEIRYFVTLSKTLNFTKAAEMCNVSQPALTRAIQKMEDELGGLLFSRERSNTHLTKLGGLLEPHLGRCWSVPTRPETDHVSCVSTARSSDWRDVHDWTSAVRQLPQSIFGPTIRVWRLRCRRLSRIGCATC